jgi:hypothetical protein
METYFSELPLEIYGLHCRDSKKPKYGKTVALLVSLCDLDLIFLCREAVRMHGYCQRLQSALHYSAQLGRTSKK